jgi:hypothetical protein
MINTFPRPIRDFYYRNRITLFHTRNLVALAAADVFLSLMFAMGATSIEFSMCLENNNCRKADTNSTILCSNSDGDLNQTRVAGVNSECKAESKKAFEDVSIKTGASLGAIMLVLYLAAVLYANCKDKCSKESDAQELPLRTNNDSDTSGTSPDYHTFSHG